MSNTFAQFFVVAIILIYFSSETSGRLEPTKIEHNGVYKLEIQSEDKFLTGVVNNTPIRSSWKNAPEQKWKFEKAQDPQTGEQAWKIAPINDVGGLTTSWKIKYVGHGKFQFTSFQTGQCLRGNGLNAVGESKCQMDDPGQRWLVVSVSP